MLRASGLYASKQCVHLNLLFSYAMKMHTSARICCSCKSVQETTD